MNIKATTPESLPQEIPAGILTNQNTIEFFGIRKNQTVQFIQCGVVKPWNQLPNQMFTLVANAYNKDKGAVSFFKTWNITYSRQVELYVYFMYGSLDHEPDIKNGILMSCENFRHSKNCPSIQFDAKQWTLNKQPITQRDLKIIDYISKELPNKAIAANLEISQSTLDYHMKQLFIKTKTQSKLGIAMMAIRAAITI